MLARLAFVSRRPLAALPWLRTALAFVALTACNVSSAPPQVHVNRAPAALPAPAAALEPPVGARGPRPVDGAVIGTVMPDFASLAARVVPAVVSVHVERKARMSQPGARGGPNGVSPFDFFHFFGQEPPQEFENRGLGSGFVIDATGLILTNAHVVEKADTIEVTFAMPDGSQKSLHATVLGQAPDYDVALLKTAEDAQAPGYLAMGNSDAVRIGDWVMAVGNPFGLDHSVSVGIISAKQRRDIQPSGRRGLYDFLQTDASINPGNSGGPLVDLHGDVIGINAAVSAQGQGIGFAIPINMVHEILPQLREGARITRSWLGLQIQAMSVELAQSFGLPSARGVLVAEVVPKGPADKAGIKGGDVVLQFENKKINRLTDLQLYASMAGAGKTVSLTLWRDKQEKVVKVRLEALNEEGAQVPGDAAPDGAEALGLQLRDVPRELRSRLNLAQGGVLVQSVEPGSPAGRAGLTRGDVLTEVDGIATPTVRDLVTRIKATKSGEAMRFRVQRQEIKSYVALRKP